MTSLKDVYQTSDTRGLILILSPFPAIWKHTLLFLLNCLSFSLKVPFQIIWPLAVRLSNVLKRHFWLLLRSHEHADEKPLVSWHSDGRELLLICTKKKQCANKGKREEDKTSKSTWVSTMQDRKHSKKWPSDTHHLNRNSERQQSFMNKVHLFNLTVYSVA